MNSGFFIAFYKCIGFVGYLWRNILSGMSEILEGRRQHSLQKNRIYRPNTAELPLETIRNSKMTYINLTRFRSLLHHCGCVTMKLGEVEAVALVHGNSNITIQGIVGILVECARHQKTRPV